MENTESTLSSESMEYAILHELEIEPTADRMNRAAWFYATSLKDPVTAGRLFFRAALLDPSSLHHRLEMARFLSDCGRLDRAVEWLQAALRLALTFRSLEKEELALIYFELARIYLLSNRQERTLRYLHLSIQACPGYPPALRLLEPA